MAQARVIRFRDEFRDFLRFVKRPTPGPRLPRAAMPALAADWVGSIRIGRLLRWVLVLWLVNLAVLGPVAAAVASMSGASHRLDPTQLPLMLALVWAPIVEELMFRFGLRRPGAALWLLPAFVLIVIYGRSPWLGSLLAALLALTAWPRLPGVRWRLRTWRRYRRWFPFVFHVAAFAFAILHLLNFTALGGVTWWLLPLFVLPQWVTGLVLGWMRVRTGIGASIALHAMFNTGPVMLLLLLSWAASMVEDSLKAM
ncbi:CPBP family intramembrane metalloprotease [Verticiella sediminum]|uniref:CPBP family intramembrane metalloprotease n=1 Tax=Verticiella sediminum TaxID=1247510 RepID=A0A556B1E2_9BURK|nr:CPBP family glutamic-type intramembrane protease [Verticiella sediminum]TSH99011.1 CPBP family intramembrane metalloprotease [Verticiella sediminum]